MSLSPQQSAWLFASSALKRWWLTRWVGRFGEQLNTPRKTNMEPEIFNPWKRKIIWTKPSFSGSMLIFGGVKNFGWFGDTVGGRNPAPVEVGSLFHYLQGYVHLRWCRVSSINGIRVCYTSGNFPKMASGFSFIHPHPKLGRKWCFVFHVQPFLLGNYMLSRPPRLVTKALGGSWKSGTSYLGDKSFDVFNGRHLQEGDPIFDEFRLFLAKSLVQFIANLQITLKKNL